MLNLVRRLGAPIAFLLAAALPAAAVLPDASWSSLALPLPAAAPPLPPPALPVPAAAPAVPPVSFKGLTLKGVQFSRTDRIPESLVAAIDKTDKTLLLAIYDLKLSEVADAIVRAKKRGVDVRMVYDMGHAAPSADPAAGAGPSAEYSALLAAGVPVRLLKGGGSFGIMHNKFAVFDGALLVTGSFNWTRAADDRNFENAVFKDDAALIDGYTRYWNWMWPLASEPKAAAAALASGTFGSEEDEAASFSALDAAAGAGAGFGAPPADPARPVAYRGGTYPRYAFSPEGGVEALLVDAIGRATRKVEVAIFSLYSPKVAGALIAAEKKGVAVSVVADAGQSRRSQAVRSLVDAGVAVRLSAGRGDGPGVMHHKWVLVDGALLMSGSYNFSQNAELYNFENDLFTTAPGETAAFGGEFAALWKQAHDPAPDELPAPKNL